MSQKVFVALKGGLGNQLYQYAAGLAVQAATGAPFLGLLPATDNAHSSTDYRSLFYRGSPVTVADLPTPIPTFSNGEAFAPWTPKAPALGSVPELLLDGYFQYLPALAPAIAEVATDLLVSFSDLRKNLSSIPDITNSVFLHVRRGDYLKNVGHLILPESYYRAAIANLPPTTRILVISDDTAWCRTAPFLQGDRFKLIEDTNEVSTLALMSLCTEGAIIANSTFSWWGAVLASASVSRPAPPVFYPSKWFRAEQPHLFPTSWGRIEA